MPFNQSRYRKQNNNCFCGQVRETVVENISNPSLSQKGVADHLTDGLLSVGAAIETTVDTVVSTVDDLFSGSADSIWNGSVTRVPRSDLNNRIKRNLEPVGQTVANRQYDQTTTTTYTFPSEPGKYYLLLQFARYSRPTSFESASIEPLESLVLPMPDNLLESYATRWNVEDAGIFGEAKINIDEAIRVIKDEDVGTLDKLATAATAAGITGAAASYRSFSTVFPVPFGIAEQTIGAIPNPHPTVFFKGIDLRSHNFQWKLSPSSEKESKDLRSIVKLIKQRMLPSFIEGQSTALTYPYVVRPILKPNTDWLYEFKWCGVKTMNVTYTPDGMPAFYKSQAPVALNLNLELQELEYFTSDEKRKIDDLSSGSQTWKDWITTS